MPCVIKTHGFIHVDGYKCDKCKCGGCNAIYYGKTKRRSKVQICEHLSISHLTRKKGKD